LFINKRENDAFEIPLNVLAVYYDSSQIRPEVEISNVGKTRPHTVSFMDVSWKNPNPDVQKKKKHAIIAKIIFLGTIQPFPHLFLLL
jgi:hypothetical protein